MPADTAAIDTARDALIAVDVQPDFMPGGALPVPGGDAVVPVVNRLLDLFAVAAATQDWHPAGHLSFASSHPGAAPFSRVVAPYGEQTLWPDHCIQGTPGAALHPGLRAERFAAVLRKGWRRDVDSYSAFTENDRKTPTGLAGWLRDQGIRRVFLAGLATDFCVGWSGLDALDHGFGVVLVPDACRGIGIPAADGGARDSTAEMLRKLEARGAAFVPSGDLRPGGSPA
ncbi:bifunctional nicotinamidase/pyrazinamidase [Craurococcus roseus]|uniref:nicotinamidase n=1 Tax=Craurococcus roseus TaxID=77585 RepID=A0ABP3PQG7_9PROT